MTIHHPTRIEDPDRIRALLGVDPYLHLYELGDLDPFFWPSTQWFAKDTALAMLYSAPGIAVLLCFSRERDPAHALLTEIRDVLPSEMYSHLSPGLFEALAPRYEAKSCGEYQKMSLRRPEMVGAAGVVPSDAVPSYAVHSGTVDTGATRSDALQSDAEILPSSRLAEVQDFFARAYPGNWFDPRMLETDRYVGVRDENGALVSVAGIHVYAPSEGVAVLGNVATLPSARGRGYGGHACRALCRILLGEGLRVGLNVARNNEPAIRCYRALGFEYEAPYEERMLKACEN
ncbi:MAG: GNAT family N-acetyltransferase [Candidatus Eisenbacteria bacterium]